MYPHPPPGQDLNIGLMLGQLMQGQRETFGRLDKIDDRLVQGDKRMSSIEDSVKKLEKPASPSSLGTTERLIKQSLQWAVPGGVLWWTGSIDQALKVLAALGAK